MPAPAPRLHLSLAIPERTDPDRRLRPHGERGTQCPVAQLSLQRRIGLGQLLHLPLERQRPKLEAQLQKKPTIHRRARGGEGQGRAASDAAAVAEGGQRGSGQGQPIHISRNTLKHAHTICKLQQLQVPVTNGMNEHDCPLLSAQPPPLSSFFPPFSSLPQPKSPASLLPHFSRRPLCCTHWRGSNGRRMPAPRQNTQAKKHIIQQPSSLVLTH